MVPSTPPPLLALLALTVLSVSAAPNMTPDYEVKLLMDPSAALNPSDHKLTPTVLSAFGMPTTVTKMNVQFHDTSSKEIYSAGWSPRIRKSEGQDTFELTYKKRYPILGDDIDGTLTTANAQGFDSGDSNYDAQVEWGYSQKTLSISRKKTVSDSGYSGVELPNTSDARKMLVDETPDKFDGWVGDSWGTTKLASARIFGPVLARRSVGTWNKTQVYVEVWPIKDAEGTGVEYIVEASFKTDSRTEAGEKHDALIAFLTGKGWFVAEDSLKAGLIMDRY
ncbi:hypothetical protein B0T14DRAFT_572079 [Immersiella caudata]|uniref:Uncharacterized protein n=1 Tax=Immersiella caudata TaxID=314043 RepID=A0AA39W4R4_9PEZI|nr:hypothetical protein B0T14DRAFT_572079 [Immersiella caudata]